MLLPLTVRVSDENLLLSVVSLQVMCHFCLLLSRFFHCLLVSISLIMMCLVLDFFGFILLGVHSASSVCFLPSLGSF